MYLFLYIISVLKCLLNYLCLCIIRPAYFLLRKRLHSIVLFIDLRLDKIYLNGISSKPLRSLYLSKSALSNHFDSLVFLVKVYRNTRRLQGFNPAFKGLFVGTGKFKGVSIFCEYKFVGR